MIAIYCSPSAAPFLAVSALQFRRSSPSLFFAPSGSENTTQVEIYIPFAFLGNIF